jgi:microcystin-dependent protein
MKKKCLNMAATLGMLFCAVQLGVAWAGGSSPFVGEIMWVPYNFAPRGWALCNGQTLPISQNTALFSLLGTQYGGNGQTTFALPNAQGSVLINAGQSPGMNSYVQGETGGAENVTLTQTEMPRHTHAVQASNQVADQASPNGNILAQSSSGSLYGTSPTANMAAGAVSLVGGGLPHNNMMPYTTLNCIIALQGVFPPRN